MATIDVLLATYNGARYLPEQLASLEAQSFTDWRLVLRDDGSSDSSVTVVRDWAQRTGRELRAIEDGRTGLGAKDNFGALLEASDAPYFACCDQDDAWLPEKLAVMLERVREAEARHGEETPVLAYSDLRVVDEQLREIAPSFRAYAGLSQPDPKRPLLGLMIQNVVAGCASVGNTALRRRALPVPSEAVMHDWWLAMVAGASGVLVDVADPTLLYRQHRGNTLGATRLSFFTMAAHVLADPRASFMRARTSTRGSQTQAGAFYERFKDELDAELAGIIETYARLREQPLSTRKRFSLRYLRWSSNALWNLVMHAIV